MFFRILGRWSYLTPSDFCFQWNQMLCRQTILPPRTLLETILRHLDRLSAQVRFGWWVYLHRNKSCSNFFSSRVPSNVLFWTSYYLRMSPGLHRGVVHSIKVGAKKDNSQQQTWKYQLSTCLLTQKNKSWKLTKIFRMPGLESINTIRFSSYHGFHKDAILTCHLARLPEDLRPALPVSCVEELLQVHFLTMLGPEMPTKHLGSQASASIMSCVWPWKSHLLQTVSYLLLEMKEPTIENTLTNHSMSSS